MVFSKLIFYFFLSFQLRQKLDLLFQDGLDQFRFMMVKTSRIDGMQGDGSIDGPDIVIDPQFCTLFHNI